MLSSSVVSNSSFTVVNDGNITETYRISCNTTTAGGSPWSPGSVRSDDVFVLRGAFYTVRPSSESFKDDDIIPEGPSDYVVCSTSTVAIDASHTGKKVYRNTKRWLWFSFQPPTTSGTAAQQEITVTISAQEDYP